MIPDNDVIQTFLQIEVTSPNIKTDLLQKLEQLDKTDSETVEFTFNVYSLSVFHKKNEVTISNDVITEDPDVKLPLTELCRLIEEYKIKPPPPLN